ncbi:MAG: hypothetical protein IJI32_07390 [Clostridia bacterium]|nr:hypothetical protein [Clostridia bacterium]
MPGAEVKRMILDAGLYLYQVADELGVTDSWFSKMLRHDFTAEDTERVKAAIEKLTK